MRTFSIDIASHEGHLACVDGDRAIALAAVGRVNDADLLPLLDVVLREAAWQIGDLERIACNLGPGGFTSVRNGVVFANALADQLQIPIAGFHGSALAVGRCHGERSRTMTAWWIHSTKTESVFVLGGQWTDPVLAPLADVLSVVKGTVAGDLTDAHREALLEAGAELAKPLPLKEVLPAFLAGLSYAKTPLVPWYGRGI